MSETIGELADRIPAGEWIDLPEYGVRVKKWADTFSIARTYPECTAPDPPCDECRAGHA